MLVLVPAWKVDVLVVLLSPYKVHRFTGPLMLIQGMTTEVVFIYNDTVDVALDFNLTQVIMHDKTTKTTKKDVMILLVLWSW